MGQFAIELRNAGYSGQIISFEPLIEYYKHLISIADDMWHIENYSVGNSNTTETINVSHKQSFHLSLIQMSLADQVFLTRSKLLIHKP
jgi:hypothetical protein